MEHSMDQVHLRPQADDRPEVDDRPQAHERPIVTEANKESVRAGHTGDNLRYVLIGSCALVIIAFIVVALLVK
jgi:hypothetical protein